MSYKKQLISQRRQKVAEMQRLMGDGHSLSTRERQQFNEIEQAIVDIDVDIAKANAGRVEAGPGNDGRGKRPSEDRSMKALQKQVRNHRTTPEDIAFTSFLRGKSGAPEFRAALDSNALSTNPNSAGLSAGATGYDAGYLIPQGFWQQLQVALKAYGGLSSSFKYVETATGQPMPWPTIDPTAMVGKYLTEQNQLGFGGDSAGTDYQFGQGMLNAWTIVSGVVLASVQLIEDSAFEVDSFVADRIGEAIGRKLAGEVYSGTGSTALLGINTALNARGSVGTSGGTITPTGGFVTLAAATTVKTFASSAPTELAGNLLGPVSLLSMIAAVDPAYYPNCKWYFNANQAWALRSVVDSNGRPLINFMNGFDSDSVTSSDYTQNAPVARLFGFPVVIDNSINNLSASTTGGPIFGSLSNAMVLRVVRNDARVVTDTHPMSPNTMKLTERYADYLQVGYLGYLRADSRSNDLRAAVTVKAAAT